MYPTIESRKRDIQLLALQLSSGGLSLSILGGMVFFARNPSFVLLGCGIGIFILGVWGIYLSTQSSELV